MTGTLAARALPPAGIGTRLFTHCYRITHAYFAVASRGPFASNSRGLCKQKVCHAAGRLELLLACQRVRVSREHILSMLKPSFRESPNRERRRRVAAETPQ